MDASITPPYPLETVEDRRFVLRAQAIAGFLFAALLLGVGLGAAEPKWSLFGVASLLGGLQAALALRGAPPAFVRAARIGTILAFALGFAA